MLSFKFLSGAIAALASFSSLAAAAEEWGSFSGQVTDVARASSTEFSLVSDLTISLNSGWSLADLAGRTEGQIENKTIAFNTADGKYYARIGYTATPTNVTDTQICFEPVPIRISLNEEVNGAAQGRLVDGYFFIGCIDKSKILGYETAAASSAVASSTTAASGSHSSASATLVSSSAIKSSTPAVSTTLATATSSALPTATASHAGNHTANITTSTATTLPQANAGSALAAFSTAGMLLMALAVMA